MQFLSPWAFWTLASIPLVIALYLLKQRFEERRVSSTYLWERMSKEFEASHPWQRLRNNLLMMLQIFILLLLTLSLARPALRSEGIGGDAVCVLDVSLSMQASDVAPTRLDQAKAELTALVDHLQPGERMSLIVAGAQSELLLPYSEDKDQLRAAISAIEPQNGHNDLTGALALARSLRDETRFSRIVIYTDQDMDISRDTDAETIAVVNLAAGADNVALTGISYAGGQNGSPSVLGMLQNYGAAATVGVECYVDGTLADIQDVELAAGGTASVLFDDLPVSAARVALVIQQDDTLNADNRAFCVIQEDVRYRVLLLSEHNLFLEKALSLREDIELIKSGSADAQLFEGYDLIIFDGILSEELPSNAPVWLINPPADALNGLVKAEEMGAGGLAAAGNDVVADQIFAYVDVGGIQFAKSKTFDLLSGQALPLGMSQGESVMAYRDGGGEKWLAMGFDLHESNLPLSGDFPILVQNILQWFLNAEKAYLQGAVATDVISLTMMSGAASMEAVLPDGETVQLAPPFPPVSLSGMQSNQSGFYELRQYDEEGELLGSRAFAVNVAQSESELRTFSALGESGGNAAAVGAKIWMNKELLLPIALLALAVMMLEWWVYNRGA